MKTLNFARAAAMLAVIALALPAPASAQFGFIKKQIKQKILSAVVDSALNKVAGQPTDSTAATRAPQRSGASGASHTTGATRGTSAAASPEAPQFDEYVIEITPKSLDGLEKYMAAQKGKARSSDRASLQALMGAPGGNSLAVVQYSLMTQRVVAYCSTISPSAPSVAALGMTEKEMEKQFTPSELRTLRPRCQRIMSLMGDES